MKPLTMLAALLDGKVTLDSTYYCPAALKVDDYTITDSHERPSEDMSVSTIIAESSNVGILAGGERPHLYALVRIHSAIPAVR